MKSHIRKSLNASYCGLELIRVLAVPIRIVNFAKKPREATCKRCRKGYGLEALRS